MLPEVAGDRPFEGSEPYTIEQVVEAHRRWLHLPDPGAVYAIAAAVAANRLPGDPLWLLAVGPSSGGKTALLGSIATLEDTYSVATLTEAALLSGTSVKERAKDAKGGLLRAVGDFGIIVCKDFGSVLSMNRDARAAVLAALRETYDGSWTRHVGTEGGKALHWEGKLGFIGGATGAIDQHHGVMAQLGERFIFYRIEVDDADAQARRSLEHVGREREMQAELAESLRGLFMLIDFASPPRLSEDDHSRLVALATLAARARSPVIRDSQRREIELVPAPEAPGRLVGALARLLTGLRLIGVDDAAAWRVTRKTALDSMPVLRRRALEYLIAASDEGDTTSAIATFLGLPNTTAHRALEDLAAHGVLARFKQGEGKADVWQVCDWTREHYEAVTSSEMSDPPKETSSEMLGGVPEGPLKKPQHTFDDFSEEVRVGPAEGAPDTMRATAAAPGEELGWR